MYRVTGQHVRAGPDRLVHAGKSEGKTLQAAAEQCRMVLCQRTALLPEAGKAPKRYQPTRPKGGAIMDVTPSWKTRRITLLNAWRQQAYSRSLTQPTISVMVFAFLVSVAFGDDLFHPRWRDANRSQVALWDDWFEGQTLPVPPNHWHCTPAGLASPLVQIPSSSMYRASYEGRQGVIKLDADDDLVINLDDYSDGLEKIVRFQITWHMITNPVPNFLRGVDVWAWNEDDEYLEGYDGRRRTPTLVAEKVHEQGWITQAFDLKIHPNPDREAIGLKFNSYSDVYVDQLVVDTICPEPGSSAGFALVAVALMRSRRFRGKALVGRQG